MSENRAGCFLSPASRVIVFMGFFKAAISFGKTGLLVFIILCLIVFFLQLWRKFWRKPKE